MPDPASSAAAGVGLKTGLIAGVGAALVAILAVVVGFTVVPLTPGREQIDAARRLAAGLLCSFTAGPALAFKAIEWWPGYLTPWQTILAGEHVLWIYLAAATPFIALTALLGFWVVAALMRWFEHRKTHDIAELAAAARDQLRGKDTP